MKPSNFGISFLTNYEIKEDHVALKINNLEFAKNQNIALRNFNPKFHKANETIVFVSAGTIFNFGYQLKEMFADIDFIYNLLCVIKKEKVIPVTKCRVYKIENLTEIQHKLVEALKKADSFLINTEEYEIARPRFSSDKVA